MKRLGIVLPFLLVTMACVYPGTMAGGYPAQRPPYSGPHGPQVQLGYLPVGRWDNVMMTAVGTPLFVLMMNGGTATGDIVSSTVDNLRLHVASGEVDVAAVDVARIDRLRNHDRDLVKDGARGAAYGAAVVGVLGLIVAHVPPPNLFAAGGIIGANQSVQDSLAARGATTIYLARGIVPPGPGPQPAPVRTGPLGPCGYGGSGCSPQVRYQGAIRR
jgi:hypothetical protein